MAMTKGLYAVGAALQKFREFTGATDIPVQHVLVFLTVAELGQETPMREIINRVGVVHSAISRAVAKLGPGPNPREPGLGLLEAYEDPYYRVRKYVRLTERGKLLLAELEKAVAKVLR